MPAPARKADSRTTTTTRTTTIPSTDLDPLIGQSLAEFEILALLGRGGMGAVYKARQASLDRLVAIKVLPEHVAEDAAFLERFSREARAAAAISHPNIVQVFSVGRDKGHEFIAMEFVDGESLSAVLKREGRLRFAGADHVAQPPAAVPGETQPKAVVPHVPDLFKQVASALAKAHAAGVVHRDIKPANILLTSDGLVKVADFGLAKREGVDHSVTTTGAALGTPLYMPPEICRGQAADARSDLYSLGATFYHLLAGKPPFEADTAAALIYKHLQVEPEPLGQAAPDAPPALCGIVRKLLRKDPADRFQTAAELLDALDRVPQPRRIPLPTGGRGGVSVPARPVSPGGVAPGRSLSPGDRARGPRRKFLMIAGTAAILCMALVLVLALILRPSSSLHFAIPSPSTRTPITEDRTPSSPRWTVYTKWPFDAAEARRRQEETAKALGVPVEQDVALGNGVKMTFVLIPAGEFLMGSPPATSPEQLQKLFGGEVRWYEPEFPQHRVTLSKPFWLGKTEVTQEQWQSVMGNNPSKYEGRPQNPVDRVRWLDCQKFLDNLSAKLKKKFRLPTEAEWEYACRAGAATLFYFGDNAQELGDYAWWIPNAGRSSHPVGRKKANAWGLQDMAGNVWEWCDDWFALYDKEPQKDPEGPVSGVFRVLRGGSWGTLDHPVAFRCAGRHLSVRPEYTGDDTGFRASMTFDLTP